MKALTREQLKRVAADLCLTSPIFVKERTDAIEAILSNDQAWRDQFDQAVRDLEQGFMAGAYARLQNLQQAEQELATARATIVTQKGLHDKMVQICMQKTRSLEDRIAVLESDNKLKFGRAIANGALAGEMKNAILWALGERGGWPTREAGQGAFYWRVELRKRLDEATSLAREWAAWDDQAPTETGWYWFKASELSEQLGIVQVFRSERAELFGNLFIPVAYRFEPNVPLCELEGVWQRTMGPQEG